MTDKQLADILAEAIRRVLIHEHLPKCRCAERFSNECDRKILTTAWNQYVAERPNDRGVF